MITTWLNDQELLRYSEVSDPELNELFQEIREITDNKFVIQEMTYKPEFSFWRKKKPTITLYTLYAVHGWDAQVINFAQDHAWSINTGVSKSYITAFFYGLLVGRRYPETKTTEP